MPSPRKNSSFPSTIAAIRNGVGSQPVPAIVSQIVNGLVLGFLYVSLTIGLSIIFGMLGVRVLLIVTFRPEFEPP
jgi:hypothetical protein